MGYIIVLAQLPGIYDVNQPESEGIVNRPCPRATPSDSGRFTVINPWPHAITITYHTGVVQPAQGAFEGGVVY